MSEKTRKVVDHSGLSEEKSAEATKMRLDRENMDENHEGVLQIEFMKVPDTEDVFTTRIEMHGNISNVIDAMAKAAMEDETFANVMFSLMDSLMLYRLGEMQGGTGEAGDIIPMAKGGDA